MRDCRKAVHSQVGGLHSTARRACKAPKSETVVQYHVLSFWGLHTVSVEPLAGASQTISGVQGNDHEPHFGKIQIAVTLDQK